MTKKAWEYEYDSDTSHGQSLWNNLKDPVKKDCGTDDPGKVCSCLDNCTNGDRLEKKDESPGEQSSLVKTSLKYGAKISQRI